MHVARGQMAIHKKRQKTRRFCFHLGVGAVRSQRPGRKELWRRGATALLFFFRPFLLFLLETTPGPQSRFPCLAGGRAVAALPRCCFEFSLRCSRARFCLRGPPRGFFPSGYISSATRDHCLPPLSSLQLHRIRSSPGSALRGGLCSLCSVLPRDPRASELRGPELAPERPLQPRGNHRTCPAHREPPAPLPAASGTAPEGK